MGNGTRGFVFGLLFLSWLSSTALAQPEGFEGLIAKEKKKDVLFLPILVPELQGRFPKNSKLRQLPDLEFTGPKPSHPFVLGNFYADGHWGLKNGELQLIDGKNAAMQLAWAENFELDGIIEQNKFGGWFFLIGWDEGRGFAIHNVTMKESGSPWFVSEFRGGKAVEDRTQEFDMFEWKGAQPFRLVMLDSNLTLQIGRHTVFKEQPLEGYDAGRIILGVYDTRYGPRPLSVKSLRIQGLKSKMVAEP